MRCPSVDDLVQAFEVSEDDARLIRRLGSLDDEPERLRSLVEERCEETARYAASCYGDPFDSQIWRVTMVLHAVNEIVGGCGVEGLGPPRSGDYAPPYEYVNFGDPYATTLVYDREADSLLIGCWADVHEGHCDEWCGDGEGDSDEDLDDEDEEEEEIE